MKNKGKKKGKEQKLGILAVKPRKKTTHTSNYDLAKKNLPKSKRSQEEMVGFALIVIIVAVILVVFLAMSLRKDGKEPIESYEVEGFINAMLNYHTECEDSRRGFIQIRDLIYWCEDDRKCLEDKDSCDILKEALEGIVDASWVFGEDTVLKGYTLNLTVDGGEIQGIPSYSEGNITYNSWGTSEKLPRRIEVRFTAYY